MPHNTSLLKFTKTVFISLLFVTLIGISPAYAMPQITNGQPAAIGQFPWDVEILLQGSPVTPSTMGGCGGMLIAPDWVLTAAHCAADYFSGYMPQAVVGATSLSKEDHYQVINVDKIFIDPNYIKYESTKKYGNSAYDFALLHLVKPAKNKPLSLIGSHIQLVAPYKRAITMGWGNTGRGGESQKLMYVNMPIDQAAACKSLYKYKGVQWFNNTIMICAGSTSGIRYNAARGDSGGPLIVMNDNHTYLVGVVSWGDPNDPGFQKAHPAVYARVSAVENWIFSTITTYDEKPRPDLTRC